MARDSYGSIQDREDRDDTDLQSTASKDAEQTPLPKRQLAILCFACLAEQTAFNNIAPYLPQMVRSFHISSSEGDVSFYVGVIASSFLLAQSVTNFGWGWLSDKIGRKPVIVIGTAGTAIGILGFGYADTLKKAILTQVFIGLVNANQGVISTVLGEITDDSNQSAAFSYLPFVWGLGSIVGPAMGGVLASPADAFPGLFGQELFKRYPYLLPNLASALLLLIDLILIIFFLSESHKKKTPAFVNRIRVLFLRVWQWHTTPSTSRSAYPGTPSADSDPHRPLLRPSASKAARSSFWQRKDEWKQLRTPNIFSILLTFAIFSFAVVAYGQLFPVFLSTPYPIGRDMNPRDIGIMLAASGIASIVAQITLYERLQERFGTRRCYQLGFAVFAVAFFATPFIGLGPGFLSSKAGLWAGALVVLSLRTIATVLGMTCIMLLITNAAPSDSTLGSLNGLSQAVAAVFRAMGPFGSGAIFTASERMVGQAWPLGGFLAWNVVGCVLVLGLAGTWWVKGEEKDYREEGETGWEERV